MEKLLEVLKQKVEELSEKNKDYNCHTWLIAELLAFADTFITYWSLL